MKWNKYTLKTTTEAVDLVSSMMNDAGVEGIEIDDNVQLSPDDIKTMFVDFIPDLPPDEGIAYVSFYIDSDEDDGTVLANVLAGVEELKQYADIGEGVMVESETEDKDWINNWKQYFHPFTIGDLYIKPTWEPYTEAMEGHIVVNIDPGTAFGTGSHETTQLVIEELQKYVKKDDLILDVGCGSGILSVIALMLGAKKAVGTDLDPNAIIASHENAEVNNISLDKLEIIEGNIIDDKAIKDAVGYECYDIVCANILPVVLIPLIDVIADHMKHGALILTSGIILEKEKEIVEAFENNDQFEVVGVNRQNEWVNVTARKR